ncbi:hypothetical protein ABZ864_11485 [Streptomyces sp. NPDC047082]|uniref:hypothetical protein n=1 Tax=Streptomyces sp. NPDC047082 TaxID=3155259 RepID=UPI0033C4255A
MPDQQPPHPLTGAELSARLHGLVAHNAALAPTTGAQVRSRAVRRRRTRHAALSATALAAAALIAVTTGALGSSAKPTAPPATSVSHTPTPVPPPTPVQRVTVDLNSNLLTIEGKDYGIVGPMDICPIGEKSVTVTAKYPTLTMPSSTVGKGGDAKVRRWAVTFTDRNHHERLLMWAMDSDGFNSVGRRTNPGSIGLGPATGKEVYDVIRPGARVEIKGWQAANAQPDSVCSDRRPITGNR